MPKRKVTIRDISKHCGVSIATVSRVINQTGRFSEKTRQTVQNAIDELGYVPDGSAKSLRTNTTSIVGILINELDYSMSTSLVERMQDLLFDGGYTPVLCNVESHVEREEFYCNMLRSINACAIIVVMRRPISEKFLELGVPIIYLYRNPLYGTTDNDMISVIQTDDYGAGCIAAEELLRLGCKRISEVRTPGADARVSLGRHVGLLNTLFQHNADYDESLEMVISAKDFPGMLAHINQKLNTGVIADGYFCVNDMLALALVQSLTAHGYQVGDDIKVIGCNNMPCALYNSRPITSIRHDTDALCASVMDVMTRMLRGEALPKEDRFQIKGVQIVRRGTT